MRTSPPISPAALVREEEAALIARAAGEPEAFATLYRQTYDAVASYVVRRVGDRSATEEILSDVYFQALRGIGAYEDRGQPFVWWLIKIAGNAVRRWNRTRGRREGLLARLKGERVEPSDPPQVEPVRSALLALPEDLQEVLALRYLEGLQVRDVALLLGLPEGTVKSRLARGRDTLREQLERIERT